MISVDRGLLLVATTGLVLPTVVASIHHPLHEGDIIIFGNVPILKEIRALVSRHRLNEIFDKVVRDEGMPEIEFRNIGL